MASSTPVPETGLSLRVQHTGRVKPLTVTLKGWHLWSLPCGPEGVHHSTIRSDTSTDSLAEDVASESLEDVGSESSPGPSTM